MASGGKYPNAKVCVTRAIRLSRLQTRPRSLPTMLQIRAAWTPDGWFLGNRTSSWRIWPRRPPLPMIPIWAQMVLGGVVYTVVPFYKRVRKVQDDPMNYKLLLHVHVLHYLEKHVHVLQFLATCCDDCIAMSSEALDNAETAEEVVEHIAEVTEKLAANVANSLPEDGTPQKVAVEVEYIAEVVDKDAHKVEAVINKIEALSDQIDAAVEPVIEELENDFKPNTTSSSGSDGQK
ncbi:uncharacterized protein LOC133902467 isoform X1 [Phragmites australis]|uniref:uncharacterized protein LOC133902467 isoform X1 n=1 Tax=Phragmites australis TaxID=29695 RepID=UPI002D784A51|nr:uncharacterized protein LOC133902467 isoform X1 [Phragmites australis]